MDHLPSDKSVRSTATVAALAVCGLIVVSAAHASIGKAVAVIQDATAEGDTGARVLEIGASVFIGDLLKSGPVGLAQLVFSDDTRLVVGPNSSLRVDTYLLRNQDTVENLSISALRGSFRFLSGNSPSKAYQITTANATIGVRGTGFDISSRADATGVLTYSGNVDICNLQQACRSAQPGELFDVGPQGNITNIEDPAEKLAYMQQYFPFAFDQSLLLALFLVDTNVVFRSNDIRPKAGSPG